MYIYKYFVTFDYCRYLTHSSWAEGSVEVEDALLPYPKKAKSSTTDTRLTLPVLPRTGVSESVTATEELPTTSAVSSQLAEEHNADTWAMSDTEESEAFWGHSSTRTSCTVEEWTCDEGGEGHTSAAAEASDNTALRRQSATQTTCSVKELTGNEHVGSVTVDASVVTQDITYPGTVAVSAASSSILEDTERQKEVSSKNIDETFIAAADSVSEAGILSTTRYICSGRQYSDVAHTVSSDHCQRSSSSVPAADSMNVQMISQSDDVSVDECCVDNDVDADTCVLDDTEDSDMDDSFIASRSLWQTMMKKDPYPVKERLLLSLEEVSSCDLLF